MGFLPGPETLKMSGRGEEVNPPLAKILTPAVMNNL
jgi:hypothetical protein